MQLRLRLGHRLDSGGGAVSATVVAVAAFVDLFELWFRLWWRGVRFFSGVNNINKYRLCFQAGLR